MCSFSSNEDLVVIIDPVLPRFAMITSLNFSLLRPILANVRLISDIDKIGIEHLVLNDGIIVVRDYQNNGKYGCWNYSFPCPIFDRFFPTYVRVMFS